MRSLWIAEDWEVYFPTSENRRKGLRLRIDKDVDPEVKRACKEFVDWLRQDYEFPMRVPVYIKSSEQIKSMSGELYSAIFSGPYDKIYEPHIRVSAGDYEMLKEERGQDSALACILCSIAHELSHYFQWVKDLDLSEYSKERQAKYYARAIVYKDYADTRDHP